MTIIKKYNFSEKEITAIVSDETNGYYLWIAFAQDSDGYCKLQKVSANDLNQVYFDIDLEVSEIKKMMIYGTFIYLALDDETYIGRRYSLSNPITTYTNVAIPSGIIEAPVDIYVDASYIYYLIPGDYSGTNTKIVIFTLAGVYSSTIDLATITNANSFVKVGTEYWITTFTSPSSFVRVYNDGGWTYTINY